MYKTRKKTCQTKKTEVGAIFTTQLWLNTWIFEIKMFLYIKQCKKKPRYIYLFHDHFLGNFCKRRRGPKSMGKWLQDENDQTVA